jgi:hypothetical protein
MSRTMVRLMRRNFHRDTATPPSDRAQILRLACLTGTQPSLYRRHSSLLFFLLFLSSRCESNSNMLARNTLVGCIAALSAVVHAQDDFQKSSPTIWDRVDFPFTFTDCAAPTEMETCWKAQTFTAEDYYDTECLGLQNRIDCALTNCWNRV